MSAENVTSAAMHDKQKISSTKITPPKSLDFNLCMNMTIEMIIQVCSKKGNFRSIIQSKL